MKIFAERLKETLRVNGMTQSELARRVNMSPDAISGYCRGIRTPAYEILVLICKELGESSDYLLGLTN